MSNSRPLAPCRVIRLTRSPSAFSSFSITSDDVIEEARQRLEIGQRADQFLQVLQPPRRLGRLVLLPHLRVAALVEHGGDRDARGRRAASIARQRAKPRSSVASASFTLPFSPPLGDQLARPRCDSGTPCSRAVSCIVRSATSPTPRRGTLTIRSNARSSAGCAEHAHIGDGVADLGALVEAQAADHAIRDAEGDQPLLEGAGLEAGADQDRHLGQRVAVAAQRLDPVADHAGLLVGVPQADDA